MHVKGRNISKTLLSLLLGLMPLLSQAHPANIPIARAKISVDGAVELSLRFDVLAFVLDEDPMTALDPPMNALLDSPPTALQTRLDEAKVRLGSELLVDDINAGTGAIDFPTAVEIQKSVAQTPKSRLPVMMTLHVRLRLSKNERTSYFKFPKALGTVILTTEFPYIEPKSEAVEPGTTSQRLVIPTSLQIAALAESMSTPPTQSNWNRFPTERVARKAIQGLYNRWSKAYMAHDVDTVLAMLTPDYTIKTAKGDLIHRDEYATMLRIRKQKHSDTTQYETKILRINLHDGIAALYSEETTTNPKLNPQTNRIEGVKYRHDYIDVWVFSGGRWLLKSTVTLREQTLAPR